MQPSGARKTKLLSFLRHPTHCTQVDQFDGRRTLVARQVRESRMPSAAWSARNAKFQGTRNERSSIRTLPANQFSPAGPVPIGPIAWLNSMNAAVALEGTAPPLKVIFE